MIDLACENPEKAFPERKGFLTQAGGVISVEVLYGKRREKAFRGVRL